MSNTKRTKVWLYAACVATGLLAAGNASATIQFAAGNNPEPNEQNILFGQSETGATITGQTQSGQNVVFSSLTGQTLYQNAKGQADIFCIPVTSGPNKTTCTNDGGNSTTDLNSLEIKLQSGFGSTDFIGNMQSGTGTAKIAVTDQFGVVFTYALGNGQNFFTLTAIDNEVITDIQITNNSTTGAAFGFGEFKQPRISGVCTLVGTTCTPVPVSEPASAAILGVTLAGLGLLRRSRTRRQAAAA